MHACGHDIHLAAVLSFALFLKQYEKMLHFPVCFFFQPAEETTGGAEAMIADGALKDPEVGHMIGFHVNPRLPAGTAEFLPGIMNAAVTDFELTVHGASCHGAHPEEGCDAIVASAAIIQALQSVPSRRFAPTTPVIVTVGTVHAGNENNIVAGEAVMTGTLRALDQTVMDRLTEAVRKICLETASAFGADAEFRTTVSYPALENDREYTERLETAAVRVLGKENVLRMEAPSLGADDFSFFASQARSCYFNIGCLGKGQDQEGQALHSDRLSPDESCMMTVMGLLADFLFGS